MVFRQSKGIRLLKPSDNLVKAYLVKSRNALRSMDVNAKEGIAEWAVSASYYAKYFVVYALLEKIGVRCEIHDCTIALFEYLFHNRAPPELIQELRESKEDRVETQYYPVTVEVNLEQLKSKTKDFVLEVEKMLDGLTSDEIRDLVGRLKRFRRRHHGATENR